MFGRELSLKDKHCFLKVTLTASRPLGRSPQKLAKCNYALLLLTTIPWAHMCSAMF